MAVKKDVLLTVHQIDENRSIADGNADSTRSGGKRPFAWSGVVLSVLDEAVERPYSTQARRSGFLYLSIDNCWGKKD